MRATLVAVAVAAGCASLVACGENGGTEAERVPAKRLIAQAAKQMVSEGGAYVGATLRSVDGSFELHSRGRAELGLLESHVFETFETAPNEALEGATNETIYMRGLSYIRRGSERRWFAFTGTPWGPADRVFYLPKVATSLRYSGSERVLGFEATRIDGIWDARRLPSLVPSRERGLYEPQLRGVERTRMPLTVWIDRRHRIRQLRIKADLSYLWGYLAGRMGTETLRFRRFDSSIDVDPPAPREIRNWDDVAP